MSAPRLPGESDSGYQERVLAELRASEPIPRLPAESEASYAARVAECKANAIKDAAHTTAILRAMGLDRPPTDTEPRYGEWRFRRGYNSNSFVDEFWRLGGVKSSLANRAMASWYGALAQRFDGMPNQFGAGKAYAARNSALGHLRASEQIERNAANHTSLVEAEAAAKAGREKVLRLAEARRLRAALAELEAADSEVVA